MAFTIPELPSFFADDEEEAIEETSGFDIPELPSFFADDPEPIEIPELPEEPEAPVIPELPGPAVEGNIDLSKRPVVKNPDGTISTVRSISINEDGQEVLIPTISDDGRTLTDDEAVELFRQSGNHLGKFNTIEEANKAAEELSKSQGDLIDTQPDTTGLGLGTSVPQPKAVELPDLEPVETMPIPEEATPEASAHIKNVLDNYGDRFPDTAVELVTKVEQDFEANPQEYQTEEAANSRLLTLLRGPMGRNEKLRRAIVNKSAGFPEEQWGFALDQNEKDFINSIPEDREIKDRFFELRHPELKEGKLGVFDKLADIADRPTQLIPFVSSAVDFRDLSEVLTSARRLDNGTADEDDIRVLEYFVRRSEQDKDFGFKVVDVLSGLPAFMGELALTSGIFTAGKAATFKAGTKGLSKLLQKSGKDLLKKRAVELGLKATATVAGATLQTIPAGFTRIAAGTAERLLPTMEVVDSEDGEAVKILITGNGEDLMPALLKAAGSQWVETVSERSGAVLTQATGGVRGAMVRAGLINSFKKANPTKRASDIADILRKVGWNGVLEEVFEERVGELGRAALGIEEYQLPTPEQLAIELVAFSVPGAGIAGVQKIAGKQEAEQELALPLEEQRTVLGPDGKPLKPLILKETPVSPAPDVAVTPEVAPEVAEAKEEPVVPDQEALKQEAKKFDTAEEFVKEVLNKSNMSSDPRIQTIDIRKITGTDFVELDEALKSGNKITIEEAESILEPTDEFVEGQKIVFPIEVRKNEDGTFALQAGNHRLAQKLINGETTIESNVIGDRSGKSLEEIFSEAKAVTKQPATKPPAKQAKAVPKEAAKPVVAKEVKVPTSEEIEAEPQESIRKVMRRRVIAQEAGQIEEADRFQALEDALRERLELLPEQGKQLNKKMVALDKLSGKEFIKQAEKLFKETEKQLAKKTTKIKQIVRKTTGLTPVSNLITAEESTLLKDQIRREAKASKLGFTEGKSFQRVVDREIKAARTEAKKVLEGYSKALTKGKKKLTRPEFKAPFEALVDQFNKTTPSKKTIKGLEKMAEFMENNPDNIVPQKMVDQLKRLDRTNIRDLSLEEISDLTDTISMFVKQQELKDKLIFKGKLREADKVVGEAVKNLEESKQRDVADDRNFSTTDEIKRMGKFAYFKSIGQENVELVSARLDGSDGGIIQEVFYGGINEGRTVQLRTQQEAKDFLNNGFKGINMTGWSRSGVDKKKWNKDLKTQTFDLPSGKKITITPAEKIKLILDKRNEKNTKHLVEGGFSSRQNMSKVTQLSEADLVVLDESLTADEQKVADVAFEYYNSDKHQKGKLNKATLELLGAELATEDNYSPIVTNKMFRFTDFLNKNLTLTSDFMMTTLEDSGFLKKRINANTPVILEDVFESLDKSIRLTSEFIGMAKPLRNVKMLLNNTEFQRAVVRTHGPGFLDYLERYVGDLERAPFKNLKEVDHGVLDFSNKITKGILVLRPTALAKQPISFAAAGTIIPMKYLKKAASKPASVETIAKESPQLRDRMVDGNFDRDMGELGQVAGVARTFNLAPESFSARMMKLFSKFDAQSIRRIWTAVELWQDDVKPDLKGQARIDNIVAMTELVTRRTQPTFDVKDRSEVGRTRSDFVKVFTKFFSQRNKNVMMRRRAQLDYNNSEKTNADKLKFLKVHMLVTVLQAAFVMMIDATNRWLRTDPDRKDKISPNRKILFAMIRFLMAPYRDFYLVGPALDNIITGIERKQLFSSYDVNDPISSHVNDMLDAVVQGGLGVEQMVTGEKFKAGPKKREAKWKSTMLKASIRAIGAFRLTGSIVPNALDLRKYFNVIKRIEKLF